MALNYFDYYRNRDLVTDELIGKAVDLLEERYGRMANYIKEKYGDYYCEICNNDLLEYHHHGIKCQNCGHFYDIEIPHQQCVKIGCTSRTLESVIRELFGMAMGKRRKENKPQEKDVANLPFGIQEFDTGEYSPEEVKYLNKRFNQLISENNISHSVDRFLVRSLCIQELKIMKLERLDAIGRSIKAIDKKREYDIYNELTDKLVASRDKRGNVEEEDFFVTMEKKLEDTNIEELLEKYVDVEKEREEYIEEANKRKKEVGNPY